MKCLPVFNGFFYRVLPSFFGVHWGTSSAKRIYRVFTGFYRVLLGFTEFYWVLLGFTEFYRVIPSFFGVYLVVFFLFECGWGLTEFYRVFGCRAEARGKRVCDFIGRASSWLSSATKKKTNKQNKQNQTKEKKPKNSKSHRNGRVITGFYCFFFFLNRIVCVFLWSFTDCYLV